MYCFGIKFYSLFHFCFSLLLSYFLSFESVAFSISLVSAFVCSYLIFSSFPFSLFPLFLCFVFVLFCFLFWFFVLFHWSVAPLVVQFGFAFNLSLPFCLYLALLLIFLQSLLSFTSFRSTVSLPISLFLPCLVSYFLFPSSSALSSPRGLGLNLLAALLLEGLFSNSFLGSGAFAWRARFCTVFPWGLRSPPPGSS